MAEKQGRAQSASRASWKDTLGKASLRAGFGQGVIPVSHPSSGLAHLALSLSSPSLHCSVSPPALLPATRLSPCMPSSLVPASGAYNFISSAKVCSKLSFCTCAKARPKLTPEHGALAPGLSPQMWRCIFISASRCLSSASASAQKPLSWGTHPS